MTYNRQRDVKISDMTGAASIEDADLIPIVQNGTNKKLTKKELVESIGVTGSIEQAGDVLGVPVLDKQGADNFIRNLEPGSGIDASLTPLNGIAIEHGFIAGQAGVPVVDNPLLKNPTIRAISTGVGIGAAVEGDSIRLSLTGVEPPAANTVLVFSKTDLPTPALGVITLADDTVYRVSTSLLDLGTDRIVVGKNSTFSGQSTESTTLSYTGTAPLFTVPDLTLGSFELSTINIDCPNATMMAASGTDTTQGLLTIRRATVVNCQKILTVDNCKTVLISELGVSNCAGNGFEFSNFVDILNVDSILISAWNGTLFDFGTTVFLIADIENSVFISPQQSNYIIQGEPDSGNINALGHGAIRAVNVINPFTPSASILPTDKRWDFATNNILEDSKNYAQLLTVDNALETDITAIDTPVKVNAVFTPRGLSRFLADDTGRITYNGLPPSTCTVSVNISATKAGGGTDTLTFYLYKNGAPIPDIRYTYTATSARATFSLAAIETFNSGDYIEVWCENATSASNVVVVNQNMMVK